MNLNLIINLAFALVTAAAIFWLVRSATKVAAGKSGQNLSQFLAGYGPTRGAGEMADLLGPNNELAFGGLFDKAQRKLANQLVAAGVKTSLQSWVLLCITVGVVVATLVGVASANFAAAILVGIAGGVFLPPIYLRSQVNARAAKFAQELPSLLQVLASSLRAGLSFRQALESAAINDKGEVGVQMRQALAEVQLGGELEEALFRVADRMKSLDLRWLVAALQIQREVGGSLSGILDNVANTIRTRAEIRREIQVLSAEGRLSANVLVAMPFVMMLILSFVRPGYMEFFFSSAAGIFLMAMFAVLMIVGWVWMKQLVKIEA